MLKNAVTDFENMAKDFKRVKSAIENNEVDQEYQIGIFRKSMKLSQKQADEIQSTVDYLSEKDPKFAERVVPE